MLFWSNEVYLLGNTIVGKCTPKVKPPTKIETAIGHRTDHTSWKFCRNWTSNTYILWDIYIPKFRKTYVFGGPTPSLLHRSLWSTPPFHNSPTSVQRVAPSGKKNSKWTRELSKTSICPVDIMLVTKEFHYLTYYTTSTATSNNIWPPESPSIQLRQLKW